MSGLEASDCAIATGKTFLRIYFEFKYVYLFKNCLQGLLVAQMVERLLLAGVVILGS